MKSNGYWTIIFYLNHIYFEILSLSSSIKNHLNEQLLQSPSSLKVQFHSTSLYSATCICLGGVLPQRRKLWNSFSPMDSIFIYIRKLVFSNWRGKIKLTDTLCNIFSFILKCLSWSEKSLYNWFWQDTSEEWTETGLSGPDLNLLFFLLGLC